MSMLAGPRRKQKVINLRAKNSAWSNDNNKFGQRMLEKMGWSEGKGLGAKEDGIVEHVVARYKNDEKGLGFEDKNDQWTKHEDNFNALLANLSNDDSKDEKVISGVSLEAKSKKSKARVHYHKFTRGKDLSRYSEKDLANIFGKKSLKNTQEVEEKLDDDIKVTEQVFTEKGSMEDYFKKKLAAIKSQPQVFTLDNDIGNGDGTDYVFQGFSNGNQEEKTPDNYEGFGFQCFSFYENGINKENSSIVEERTTTNDCNNKKKLKKKKRSKHQDENIELNKDMNMESITEECEKELSEKKSEMKKYVEGPMEIDEHKNEKSKKRKKAKFTTIQEAVEESQEPPVDVHVPKKKKKRKHKEVEI